MDRDEPRGVGRSHRGADSLQHDRGDYSRQKRFNRSYADDEDEEAGNHLADFVPDTFLHCFLQYCECFALRFLSKR